MKFITTSMPHPFRKYLMPHFNAFRFFMRTSWLVWFGLVAVPAPGAPANSANADPRIIKESELKYPESLINSLGQGFCTLVVVIDETGMPSNPTVLRVTHPYFVVPALRYILNTRFEPARKDWMAVKSFWTQTCWFSVTNGRGTIGDYTFGFRPIGGRNAPPEYRFDTAPDVLTVVNVVYPFELALAGVEGKAEIELLVPEDGMPERVNVVSATAPEFGAALKAMAEACLINPAIKHGRQSRSLMRRRQKFSPGSNNLTFNHETRQLITLLKSRPAEIAALGDLDEKPTALYQPAPSYPRAYDDSHITGTAEVEFFIDPKGQAQLPRIISASTPEFGWSAVTAVQQWLYQPPKKNGREVFVRARIPIEFRPVLRLSHVAQSGSNPEN
jgi:TonB family protein